VYLVANNFWGKDDAGVEPLIQRMANAKTTCDELKNFYSGTNIQPHSMPEYFTDYAVIHQ